MSEQMSRACRDASSTPVAPLVLADLARRDLTLPELDSFVPQTRAEARALAEARTRLTSGKATRRSRATGRAQAGEATVTTDARRPGSSLTSSRGRRSNGTRQPLLTKPRQAAVLLALTGVIASAQATAAGHGTTVASGANAVTPRLSSLLATPQAASLVLTDQGTSRSATRETLVQAEAVEAVEAAADTAADATVEMAQRRTEAVQDAVAIKAEADAAAAAAAAAEAAAAQAAAQAAAEAAAAQAAAAERASSRWPLTLPLEAPMVSGFGYRVHPVSGGYKLHQGLDYSARCGVVIGAAAAGKVVEAGWGGGYGNRVVVDHGTVNGSVMRTTYNHLSRTDVKVGTELGRGDQIGLVGTTGTSTGCHLHFEVQRDGTPVDPRPFL
jgi:murein DD-endopeptidase MepM/ murein hydrolase activator NlpD